MTKPEEPVPVIPQTAVAHEGENDGEKAGGQIEQEINVIKNGVQ